VLTVARSALEVNEQTRHKYCISIFQRRRWCVGLTPRSEGKLRRELESSAWRIGI